MFIHSWIDLLVSCYIIQIKNTLDVNKNEIKIKDNKLETIMALKQ